MGATTAAMLVLAHGWGLEPSVWLPAITLDFGYFGPPRLDLPERFIGIGHSLGGLWLLTQAAHRLSGLVLIGGFARFTAAPSWPGTQARPLARMRAASPAETLEAFRARCGLSPAPAARNNLALAEGLTHLTEWDARETLSQLRVPVLCLAAQDDPIVPPALAEATAALARTTVTWAPTGGHILPLTAPAWCAERIAAWQA